MPEIAEVHRLVHFLRRHLVGKTIAKVSTVDDQNVFGKVGTSGPAFEKAVNGKKVTSAGSQGKYFWITFDAPPHSVMHLGMTGWIHIKGVRTAYTNYYKKMKPGEEDQWPPKFWKFLIETTDNPPVEIAFTDPRRFGRIRLVDCPADKIRQFSPLVENGPDPVVDVEIFTEKFLRDKMKGRHVPIKALLLDQAMLSGIGNWVADEVLFQARLHPEQYSDDFDDKQIKTLYETIRDVTQTACDLLGDSDEFPDHWLFHYRWGKGGKGAASVLPNGEKLAFMTVGGRTSCYAPALQKKTGRIPSGVKVEEVPEEPKKEGKKPKTESPKKAKKVKTEENDKPKKPELIKNAKTVETEEDEKHEKTARVPRKREAAEVEPAPEPKRKRRGGLSSRVFERLSAEKGGAKEKEQNSTDSGRRRSGRLSGKSS